MASGYPTYRRSGRIRSQLDEPGRRWSATSIRSCGRTVFGTGAYNTFRVRPALSRGADPVGLRRSAGIELALAGAVLLAPAVLVATPSPMEGQGKEPHGVARECPLLVRWGHSRRGHRWLWGCEGANDRSVTASATSPSARSVMGPSPGFLAGMSYLFP